MKAPPTETAEEKLVGLDGLPSLAMVVVGVVGLHSMYSSSILE